MRRTHGEEVLHLRGLMSSGRFLGDGSERVPDYTAGQESAWWRGQRGDCRALRSQPMDFFSAGRLCKPGKQKNNALSLLYKVCIERCRYCIERCRYCIERRYSRYSRYCIERCTIGNVTITINDNVCCCCCCCCCFLFCFLHIQYPIAVTVLSVAVAVLSNALPLLY